MMKKTNDKHGLVQRMDERNKQMALKVMAVMYLITIISLQVIVIYRQLALEQDIKEFEDIAIVVTINSLFLVSALLYFGAIPIRRISIKSLIIIYLGLVLLGSLFTYLKYNVILDQNLTFSQLFDKLVAIFSIIGIMLLFFIILYLLGKRRLEKEIE